MEGERRKEESYNPAFPAGLSIQLSALNFLRFCTILSGFDFLRVPWIFAGLVAILDDAVDLALPNPNFLPVL